MPAYQIATACYDPTNPRAQDVITVVADQAPPQGMLMPHLARRLEAFNASLPLRESPDFVLPMQSREFTARLSEDMVRYERLTDRASQYEEESIAEGWIISECTGSDNGRWQIQKIDDPEEVGAPELDSDEAAWRIVLEGKKPHHAHAREFISEVNPKEWSSMLNWAAGQVSSETVDAFDRLSNVNEARKKLETIMEAQRAYMQAMAFGDYEVGAVWSGREDGVMLAQVEITVPGVSHAFLSCSLGQETEDGCFRPEVKVQTGAWGEGQALETIFSRQVLPEQADSASSASEEAIGHYELADAMVKLARLSGEGREALMAHIEVMKNQEAEASVQRG